MHIFKKILSYFILQFFFINFSYGDVINNFEIVGNKRISDETILMFSNLEIGSNFNKDQLNNALKELYYTDYFENVTISYDNNIVKIIVVENPIIQKIIINGVKERKLIEIIDEVTSKLNKYPLIENKINDQVILLKNILKSYGYYFVKLETSYLMNKNNTVDLIYNFNLGEIAKIKKIKFIGDKIFSDGTLRNIIVSEESKFWKFLTRNKYLDSNRIKIDRIKLEDFYKNRGFYGVKIKSTFAIINNENQFELIFNINSGKKFYFDKIQIKETNNIQIDNLKLFEKRFSNLLGEKYSKTKIENLINDLNEYALNNDFVFINATFNEIIKDNNLIDININFENIKKTYIDRINILGNFITDEKVIRNMLIVDEGDPFNQILFEKSIQDIKSKNLFKTVEYNIIDTESISKVVDIKVEEKATGEIFAGAGTGTSGSSITGGVKENNYLGLGIKLDANLAITEDSIKGKFSVLNPNYKNSDKSINTVIESSSDDFMSSSGYKTSRTGLTLGTEFEQFNNFFVSFEISNYYEDLETSSTATEIVKKQEGNYFENLLTYALKYNRLDQNFQPTDGYINYFSQTLPIYSDDLSIENTFTSSGYQTLGDNLILSANLYMQAINSLDDNVRVSKRVYVPSRRLRGFESGKIGPKDGSQFIGGNYATSLNLNSTIPNIFFENEDVDFNLFLDFANVWEVDYNDSLDSNKIRSSTGFALNWFSPIGPFTFSYAIPLSEANTDITEKVRFQIGTSF